MTVAGRGRRRSDTRRRPPPSGRSAPPGTALSGHRCVYGPPRGLATWGAVVALPAYGRWCVSDFLAAFGSQWGLAVRSVDRD